MKVKRSIQVYYTALQVLYWISVGLTFSYASVYLQSRGVANSQIGLVLAAAYVLAALLQPVIASVIDRWELPLARGAACLYGVAALLALGLYMLPLSTAAVLILMVLTFSLVSALQPSINSLARVLELQKLPVNFGAARGAASLLYALVMAVMGQLLERVSPLFLPLGYCAVMVVSVVLLLACRPLRGAVLQVRSASGRFPPVKAYPAFWLLLLGVVCLSMGEGFSSLFLLQIMQDVGGDSGTTGLAMGICAAVEFVSMLLFSRASRRFGVRRLMTLAGWAWVLKELLLYLAPSPGVIYAIFLLQGITYALYIPGSIELVSQLLPENVFLKGQSLTVSCYTVGCVLASLCGGVLLDTVGVKPALGLLTVVMLMGAILMTVANRLSLKRENRE